MASHLFGTKPLSKPILTHCQWEDSINNAWYLWWTTLEPLIWPQGQMTNELVKQNDFC